MNINAAMRVQRTASMQVTLRRRLLPVLVAGCFGTAFANPLGPQVINGQAGFLSQGNVLSVTNTPGTIINWQSFSINPGELTRFIQQNPNSAVLNRIIGQDPSQILGALQSNGRVFLVNPNGILFGQGAQVDVNGLVASTLNISNEDFLNGKMLFKAGDKAGNLKNEGSITTPAGGQVYLIAPNVENSGIITSPKGDVMLAAGHTVQLVDSMNPDVRVVLSAPEHEALNLGQVIAQGGRTGVYGALVKQRGIINADSAVVGENGKVILKSSRDTLVEAGSRTTAKGTGKGGEIQVLGERVALTGDAKVDASGEQGGGTVLVGGDFQGRNAGVQNAQRTYVGKDVQIKADAVANGDGGKVIVWADEDTRAYGSISARGGAAAGDGGLVEVSGKRTLDFLGAVDTSASNGKYGTLLLDPTDINIVTGSVFDGAASSLAASDANSAGTGDYIWSFTEDTGSPRSIGTTDIATLLNSNSLELQASNNISWGTGANLAYTGAASSLTLKAGNNISLESSLTSSNALNVSFMANSGMTLTGATINANAGHVKLLAGTSLGLTNSAVQSTTGDVTLMGGWNLSTGVPAATGTGGISLASSHATASSVILKAGNAGIATSGTGTYGANNNFLAGYIGLESIGSINVTSLDGNVAARTTGTGSSITLQDPGALIVSGTSVGGISAGITTNDGSVTLTAAAGLLGVNGPISAGNAAVTLNGNAATYGVDVNAAISGGSATINGNSFGISIDGNITVPGTLSLISPGGTISQSSLISAPGGIKAVGGTVILNQANPTGIIAGSSTLGDFEFESAQTLTLQTVGGTAGINAGANAVKLKSTHAGGINQNNTAPLVAGSLGLISSGPVVLTHSGNSFSTLAANLTGGAGFLEVFTSGVLSVGGPITVDGTSVTGITTTNKSIELLAGVGLTVDAPIAAGTGDIFISADTLDLNSSVTTTGTGVVSISPKTTGRAITVGSSACVGTSPCLAVYDLHQVNAPTIGIGSDDTFDLSGDIHVAGITNSGSTAATDRHANTTRIGLLTGGGVAQSGAIDVSELGIVAGGAVTLALNNPVSKLAAELAGANQSLSFNSSNPAGLTVGSLTGGSVSTGSDYAVVGVTANGGDITLNASSGPLNVGSVIDTVSGDVILNAAGNITVGANVLTGPAGTITAVSSGNIAVSSTMDAGASGVVTLTATTGAISGTGTVKGSFLNTLASGGIALVSQVAGFAADNTGLSSNISLVNTGALTLYNVKQSTAGSTGGISISNTGALSTDVEHEVSTKGGPISLVAHSPLTIDGTVSSVSGNINLQASGTGSSATGDTLTIGASGSVTSTTGNITLSAGNGIVGMTTSNVVTSGSISATANTNSPVNTPPPPPTVDQCVADPTLSGCSTVLPTLATCTTAPTTTGCSAVLPTVDTCVANPTQTGCTAVLPTLDVCTTSPATTGCSVVLPTLATCTTAPTTPGCSVVLPTLATCTTAPTTPGCTVVLPTVDACTVNPTQAGCSVVLPTLSSCTTNPTQAGCTVVLPPLSICTTAPTTPGCTAVLPTVDACTINPTQAGCSVVLPTLSSCTSNPAQAGCSVVLPSMTACTTTPTLAGCTAVLPTLTQCAATPTLEGCSVVVPTASQCIINPSAPECQVVLPVANTGSDQPPANTITVAVNETTNTVVMTTQAAPIQASAGSGSSSGGSSKPSENSDEKKDEKRTTSTADDSGAKKNEPVKKMYCN